MNEFGVRTPEIAAPTEQRYGGLQLVIGHFNRVLFDNRLPLPLIVLQRQRNTLGHYCSDRFVSMSGDGRRVDELSLNPAFFRSRGPREVCSTVVHEQCHAFVRHFGSSPKKAGYHGRPWVEVMKRVGLQPSHTGAPGGKEIGYKMDHFIVENGPFDRAFAELMRITTIAWGDALPQEEEEDNLPPKPKRLTFRCLCCDEVKAQAVPSMKGKLFCGPCGNIELVA